MIKFCGFYSFTSIITRFFTSSMLLFCNLSTKCGNGYSHRLRAVALKLVLGLLLRNGDLWTLRKSPVERRSQLETVANVALIDSILSYRKLYSFNIIITCQIWWIDFDSTRVALKKANQQFFIWSCRHDERNQHFILTCRSIILETDLNSTIWSSILSSNRWK